jgi:hypothetical protein
MNAHDDQLSVEAAGKVVGISPRTLRSWIVHGKLPATGGQRGKLVRLADVIAVAREESVTHLSVSDRGPNGSGPAGSELMAPDSSASSRNPFDGLLEELRDGVIWPLAERVEVLARENSRLAAERDAALRARDEMAVKFSTDNRFVDRLVELLQGELDAAHRRIAELEEQLARATTEATAGPGEPPTAPRGIGRRRLSPRDPVEPVAAEDAFALRLTVAEAEPSSPEPSPPAPPWWQPWRRR